MHQFRTTKSLFKKAIQELLREAPANYADKEAALPAYAHKNPFIDYLFWGRMRTVDELVRRLTVSKGPLHVLDFGCGTGVMAYHFAQLGHTVIGTDTVFEPLERIQRKITFPPNCSFVTAEKLSELPAASVDVLLALDVLEHVDSLDDTIVVFKRLLKPDGVLIVSGPTENVLYNIGRRLAGREFTGEYHVSNIHDIEVRLAQEGVIRDKKTLYPFAPLFAIFTTRFTSKQ